MASSLVQPSRPHSYHPIPHSRGPSLHLHAKKSVALDRSSLENPTHPSASRITRPMSFRQSSSFDVPSCSSSVQDRLMKLEASLPIIHDVYQREMSALRTEIESLKGVIISKTSLNKNAPPFVPGPVPMTPLSPVDSNRPPPIMLGMSAVTQDSYVPSNITPPGMTPFEILPPQEQIFSLSQQVNVLSATVSQLLTTLIASPNGPLPANIPLSPLLAPNIKLPVHSNVPPSRSPAPIYPISSVPISHGGSKISGGLQSPPSRGSSRHPGNLTIPPSLASPISQGHSTIDSQSLPSTEHRLRLFSPSFCQTPLSASTPLSPLSHETSGGVCGAPPTNSLAGKWEHLGITGDVLRAIVRFGVGPPSKTQQKSIPNMLLGKDLISQSNPIQERIQSYVIPALQLIVNDMNGTSNTSNGHLSPKSVNSPLAKCNTSVKVLVIAATLDEASQAHRLARGIANLLPQPPKIVHCGASESAMDLMQPPSAAHHSEPHLLVGTPSKLLDPVNGLRGYTFDPHSFICVILDEMDQLLARNLSDTVTSLMAFLPSNSSATSCPSEIGQLSRPMPSPKHETEARKSPSLSVGSPEEWTSSRQLRQSPQNSVTSSSSSEGKADITGRQTCIFSCTVPQDVLSYARSLNLRVKVIVRREDSNNSGATSNTPSAMTPLASNFDISDPRAPQVPAFPWTNQSGSGNSTSTHQLLRHLSQFFYRTEHGASSSPNVRERKLRALIELLLDKEVNTLRAGRGQLVIVYCNSVDSVEVVSRALGQNNIDVLALHQDMSPAARHSLLAKFGKAARESPEHASIQSMKVLVVYDVLAKTLADISKDQPSVVVNFELPRAVEDYIHRAGCIINVMNGSQSWKGSTSAHQADAALINLVNAGSEIETIKAIESFYRCKIQELRGTSHI